MLILLCLLTYLTGSIPTGLLLTKAAGLGDIRAIGSGNIGATNVLRTGNKKLAALTLLLDMVKGVAAVWIGTLIVPGTEIIAGTCAVLGHVFPVWLIFKGGKGVATAFGVLFAVKFLLGLAAAATWFAVFSFSRFSSFSALVTFLLVPIYALFLMTPADAVMILPIVIIVFFRHRENINRLLKGEEPKTTFKKQASE